MTIFEIGVAIIGGFLAGCINTLAGNGSTITLGLLTEFLNLAPNVANATNRIGIFVQSIASLTAFHNNKQTDFLKHWQFIIAGCVGAICGAYVSIIIDPQLFYAIYKYLMVALLLIVLVNPERWIKPTALFDKRYNIWFIPVFFLLGFYGGFIQMGMGLFLLAVTVLIFGIDLIQSNAFKMVFVTSFTFIILILFQSHQLINWKIGITIAIGQGIGGYLTAHYASRVKNAALIAYRMLIIIMIFTIIRIFKIDHLVISYFN